MSSRPSIEQALAAFTIFGVDMMGSLRPARTPGEAQAIYERVKKEAKANWRTMAFKLHPDRGGDVEEFKRMSGLWTELSGLKVQFQAPMPKPQIVWRTVSTYGPYGPSTSTTTTGTGGW